MIEVIKSTPMEDYTVPEGLEAFAVFDNGILCGTILFYIKADKLTISDIKIQNEVSGLNLVDVLLRAAASYSKEKGVIKVGSKNSGLAETLVPLGFEADGKVLSADLNDLLKKQCTHGEANINEN